MEFKSDEGMIVKNFIIEDGKITIMDSRDLFSIGCDFVETTILCPGGEEEFLKIASGCTFINCDFPEQHQIDGEKYENLDIKTD